MPLVINGRFLTRPVTGVERYGRLLLRIIAREWPGTRVVVPGEATDRIDACGLEIVPLGGRGGHAWEQIQLPRAVGRRDVLLSPANTGPLRVRNQVVAIHDLAVIHHPEWFDRRFAAWYGFLLPRLARRAARVITVSSYSAADLIQTFTLHSDRVMLVQPFTDIASTVGSDADIGMPYCLMVSSNDPRKGCERVINWFKDLKDPAFQLVMVGRSGKAFTSVERSHIPGVIMLNDVDDARLHALYRNATALLQPSYHEGFGLPILEAMQCGCPVIASDLLVFHQLFGKAPLYVDHWDPANVHAAMDHVTDTVRRQTLIKAGVQCASEFSEQRMTDQLHTVLDPLLELR